MFKSNWCLNICYWCIGFIQTIIYVCELNYIIVDNVLFFRLFFWCEDALWRLCWYWKIILILTFIHVHTRVSQQWLHIMEAIEKMRRFYMNKQIFKQTISVPGIAWILLFRSARKANASFSIFDNKNKDLYHTIKKNIVGGPSIIFHRH